MGAVFLTEWSGANNGLPAGTEAELDTVLADNYGWIRTVRSEADIDPEAPYVSPHHFAQAASHHWEQVAYPTYMMLSLYKVSYGVSVDEEGNPVRYTNYLDSWTAAGTFIPPPQRMHFTVLTDYTEVRSTAERPGVWDNYWEGYNFTVPLSGGRWRFTCDRDLAADKVVRLSVVVYDG